MHVPVCPCMYTSVCTSTSTCVYMHVYLCVYLCMCICVCTWVCTCTCTYVSACVPVHVPACVPVCTCLCVYLGECVCIYTQLFLVSLSFSTSSWGIWIRSFWRAELESWGEWRRQNGGRELPPSWWPHSGQQTGPADSRANPHLQELHPAGWRWARSPSEPRAQRICAESLPSCQQGNLGQASENLWGVRFTPLWTVSGVGVVVSDAPQMHGGHLASSPQSPEQLGWAASGWVELLGAFFWGLGLGNCGASPGQCEGHRTLTVSLCPLGTRKEPGVTESIRLRGLGLHPNAHLLLPRWPCHLNVLTGQVGTATTLQGLWGVPQAPRGAPSWAETQGWPCVAAEQGEKQRVCFELAMTRLKSKSVLRPWEFYFPSTFTGDHESIHPSAACVMKKTCSML